ncbi:MAG TPA: ABC transporter permease [Eubacteriaceae bacterium]|nr:ABC transporter permease [Eubacteriaceae bacterium]
MKHFFTVFKFELMHFYKNKVFLISTIIICVLLAGGLSLPSLIDGFESDPLEGGDASQEVQAFGLIDENNVIEDPSMLQAYFPNGEFTLYTEEEALKNDVEKGNLQAGFIVDSMNEFQYVIQNNEMIDSNQMVFQEAFVSTIRVQELEKLGVDYEQVAHVISPAIQSETVILGTDSASNYVYTYVLLFGLYFMVLVYGQLIATSIASEKSNRAMEILVTSTKSEYLKFGKVLGGAVAGITQFACIIGTGMIFYRLNAQAWDNQLDFIFDIPPDVLLIFSVFGVLGYLFYAFIFGALGALVSRTEDVSTSSTPITIVFAAVFILAFSGMYNTEGLMMKITSFIPFSSFLSMFVRVSMGTVATWEVVLSLVILVATTFAVGLLGAKIYRMGTLMYGNPIKLKTALKYLRDQGK